MVPKIKDEHKPLIEKIAKYTLDNNYNDDAVINLITIASTTPSGSMAHDLLRAFGSPVDLINLCHLIDHHYNLGPVCQAIINIRMTGEIEGNRGSVRME